MWPTAIVARFLPRRAAIEVPGVRAVFKSTSISVGTASIPWRTKLWTRVIEALVELYNAWCRPGPANDWRAKLLVEQPVTAKGHTGER